MANPVDNKIDKDVEAAAALLTPAQRLGVRLRQARLRLNMTQSEVASTHFSVSYISAVERGQIRPSLGALEVLSDRLQVPLEDLLGTAPLPGTASGTTQQVVDRRQEEAEARLHQAQVLSYQHRHQASIDALRQMSLSHLSPSSALEARRLLAYNYTEQGQGEEARREALDGITAAERAGDEEARARLRNELGAAYLLTRKNQLALEQFKIAHDAIAQDVARDPMFKVNVLYNLGAVNWLLGHNDDAVEYLRQAVELSEDVNHPERLGDILWSLSVTYQGQGDMARAKLYAMKSIAAYERASNEALTARAYTRLGRATAQANQIEDALEFLQKAESLSERHGDLRGQAEARRSLAAVYISQGELGEAASAVQEALDLAQRVGDVVLIAETYLTQATLQEAQGALDQATNSYETAIAMLKEDESPQHLADAYASYSAFLEQRGESARAFELLKQAWRLRETMSNA
ncbi:MAG TPA: tetratricopeptide repeat protein [Ktedonobacterales bacterium]|nr:tetratricopeptide repeat protein [Ktedonobacterales bacterium]